MEKTTDESQDKTSDDIDESLDPASQNVTTTAEVHSVQTGKDLEGLEMSDEGLNIQESENKEHGRHGSEDSTGFDLQTPGTSTEPSDTGWQRPRDQSEPQTTSNVAVRLSGTIEESATESGTTGNELPSYSNDPQHFPTAGDAAEGTTSANNADDEVRTAEANPDIGSATPDPPSDVLEDLSSSGSHTTKSTNTDFADAPFANTHSHVTLIHCMERGSFQCIPETRPLEECPLCFRRAPRDETVQLLPCRLNPREASESDLRQTPVVQPFATYNSNASAETVFVPDVVENWRYYAQQPPSPSLRVRPSSQASSAGTQPQSQTCRYQKLTNAQHVTAAFDEPFKEIRGIASSSWTDDIYLVDSWKDRIVVLNKYGAPTRQFGRNGSGECEFRNPHGIAVSERDEIIVADYWNNRVQMFDLKGHFLRDFGQRYLTNPVSVAYVDGKIYVCDETNISYFRYDGTFLGRYKGNILTPWAIAKGPQNSFVVVDAPLHKVYSFNEQCRQGPWFPTPQQGLLSCKSAGVTVDRFGYTLVTNTRNQSIDVYTPEAHQRCCSITDQRKAMGTVYDVTVLIDGRVAAACDGKIVIFRESTQETRNAQGAVRIRVPLQTLHQERSKNGSPYNVH